jgi:hypothetical protein
MIAHATASLRGGRPIFRSCSRHRSCSARTDSTYARANRAALIVADAKCSSPLGDALSTEARESRDVAILRAGEDDADRWQEPRCDPATSEYDVDEGAPSPAVPVIERVDRLELCVHQRRLRQRRQRFVVDDGAEVVDKTIHFVRRRRHEVGPARVVVVSADPILRGTDASRDVPMRGVFEEAPMNRQDLALAEPLDLR